MALHPRLRVLLIFSVALTSVSALVWFINERRGLWRNAEAVVSSPTPSATPAFEPTIEPVVETAATPAADVTPSPDAAPSPPAFASVEPMPQSSPLPAPAPPVDTGSALTIPVAGVTFDKLQNTFKDSRSGGRVHDAIDIMAPGGTPVIACTDGRIAKLFQSDRGGITLYQLSTDERTVYY